MARVRALLQCYYAERLWKEGDEFDMQPDAKGNYPQHVEVLDGPKAKRVDAAARTEQIRAEAQARLDKAIDREEEDEEPDAVLDKDEEEEEEEKPKPRRSRSKSTSKK